MQIEQIADFLETDRISFTFTDRGLKYLSLKNNKGTQSVHLKLTNQEPGPAAKLVLNETRRFLEAGVHKMPLDLSDLTAFQQNVFAMISRIEPGRVMTYKDVAMLLDKPGAARAVGSAVTKNPVSYFLPVHRVLPKRGIGICRTGAGYLREKLLVREGHDLSLLLGNYICPRKKCRFETS